MNCKEFKMEYAGKIILAFVTDNVTKIYKFDAKYITFFVRRFLEEKMPYWRNIFLFEVANMNIEITQDGKITKFEDKAQYLFLSAKRLDQKGSVCVFKKTFLPPDLSRLEGTRAKVYTLNFEKNI